MHFKPHRELHFCYTYHSHHFFLTHPVQLRTLLYNVHDTYSTQLFQLRFNLTPSRHKPFASYYDTIFSNKISRRVYTPLLNKSHHCNPHKITFQTGGQVPSEHYTNRNNHIFTHRLAKDSKFHIHKILNIS
jgi:hypothetical protein